MFSFAQPQYLYLLLLLPLIAALYWLARHARAKKIARFGRPAVVSGLMPDASRYKPWMKLTLQLLLLACIVIMLARPRAGARQVSSTVHGVEVMLCLEVSNSMNAAADDNMQDISRLQRSKLMLEKLIDRLQGNKVGLIVFAGNAYMQMPLTADAQSAKMYLNDISTSMTRRDEATDISWESRGCCTAFAPLCQGAFGDAMIVTQRAARGKRTAFQNRVARA